MVVINSNHIKYEDLKQIERILEHKGFRTMFLERKKDNLGSSDEVYTLLEKKVSDKPYYFVDVYLNYVKQEPDNIAHNLRVDVLNIYRGMTTTKLKDEIDKIGNLIYQELVVKVGKENVVMERKETPHRVIFF